MNEPAPLAHAPLSPSPQARRSARLLLAVAHEDSAKTLGRLLQRRGHHVVRADNADNALAALQEHTFDLLIIDIGRADTLALMRDIAAHGGPRAIALSGYGMEDDVRQSLEAGFHCHITKPVMMAQLDRAIEQLMVEGAPPPPGQVVILKSRV